MKCIIIGAGSFNNPKIIKEKDDLLICADGGYLYAAKQDLKVDLLVGDFDSLKDIPLDVQTVKLNKIKDETDLYIAIEEGIKRGYQTFDIYGALGGRIEHTIANIQILANLKSKGLTAKLIDDKTIVEMLSTGTYIYNERCGYISLFSYTNESTITIKNLLYEVNNKTISNEFPLGIDNEFIGKESTVTVHNGLVLSIINKKND